ncbi:hypothetical protein ACQEV2_25530 [Streptomyces sp. CA-251387]|uniref:hypothetical protein n=1 Tax=Streptomyces sp. CA-251387 TaxID=3240064 RepID=UPI003D8E3870
MRDPGEPGCVHAPADVLAERRALAERVCRETRLAGLNAFLLEGMDAAYQVGAEVEVDPGDDAAGGVLVSWKPDEALLDAAMERLQKGRLDAPEFLHYVAVCTRMQEAIVAIIRSAGIDADAEQNDLDPLILLLKPRQP